ncbi:MAG: Nif11-like leader peptide family natural product precursor [Cyanobacteria bacterium P01_D01_bin.156]
MAKEQVVKLFREAQANSTLRDTLNTAPNPEAFVAMANKRGFVFTVNEWREMTNFSVEELECELSIPNVPGI